MGYVYFIQKISSGSRLIKIGATGDCPYLRLSQLRRSLPKKSYIRLELLGALSIADEQVDYCQPAKHKLQKRFESLREKGDWFRPGILLVDYIREHARIHFCVQSCPGGTCIEEEMRALDIRAWEAIRFAQKTHQ